MTTLVKVVRFELFNKARIDEKAKRTDINRLDGPLLKAREGYQKRPIQQGDWILVT
jgi:hypothetical protein